MTPLLPIGVLPTCFEVWHSNKGVFVNLINPYISIVWFFAVLFQSTIPGHITWLVDRRYFTKLLHECVLLQTFATWVRSGCFNRVIGTWYDSFLVVSYANDLTIGISVKLISSCKQISNARMWLQLEFLALLCSWLSEGTFSGKLTRSIHINVIWSALKLFADRWLPHS